MARKITATDVQALNPCRVWYDQIPKLIGRGMTPTQIATTKKVEPQWRYWVLTRLAARTDAGRRGLVLWAVGVATDVRAGDEDTLDAIDAALHSAVAWASGVDISSDSLYAAANTTSATTSAAAYAANTAAYAANTAYAATYAAAYAAGAATSAATYARAAATSAAANAAYVAAAAANAAYVAAAAAADYCAASLDSKWLGELAALVENLQEAYPTQGQTK